MWEVTNATCEVTESPFTAVLSGAPFSCTAYSIKTERARIMEMHPRSCPFALPWYPTALCIVIIRPSSRGSARREPSSQKHSPRGCGHLRTGASTDSGITMLSPCSRMVTDVHALFDNAHTDLLLVLCSELQRQPEVILQRYEPSASPA